MITTKITFNFDRNQYSAFRDLLETNQVSLMRNIEDLDEALKGILTETQMGNVKVYKAKCALQLALVNEMLQTIVEHPKEKEKKVIIPDA